MNLTVQKSVRRTIVAPELAVHEYFTIENCKRHHDNFSCGKVPQNDDLHIMRMTQCRLQFMPSIHHRICQEYEILSHEISAF